jgi:N-acetylmuramoyl-L-alanine amidase
MKTYGPGFRPSGLILAAAMLLSQWSGAQTPKAATPQPSSATSATTVAQVGVDRLGQQTIVRVQGAGPLSYHVTQLSDPPRVVVDLGGARLTETRNTIASDYAPVRRVRLGQSRPDQVRVVIDLASPVQFEVERKDQMLLVAFSDQLQNGGVPAAPAATP